MEQSPGENPASLGFLSGGGAMGALMRGYDWHASPLGDPAGWPQSLRSAVSIMLNSRYPIALYWGAELALLYNDDWAPIPGGKHPWALGRPGREVWPEIWNTIGPLYDKVRTTGEGIWQEDELLPMLRHGYVEECYFNFTFSPVRGEDGAIDGIFNAVVETTHRVLSERRLRTLSRMGERANASLSIEGACARAIDILAENQADVAFALMYLRDGDVFRLVSSAALAPGSGAAPELVSADVPTAGPWPLAAPLQTARTVVLPAPDELGIVSSFWSEPIAEVVIAPIDAAGEERPAAFLVAGANPRRRVDATYRSFFELAAGHIATALATARAYEDERRRAHALAEIDRAKTTFFSNVSHEFRTPLTLMLGPLEEALSDTEAPAQRERLDLAHRNALRLLRLVNALLDFSRMEAGRVEATFRPTDLAALTADLASSFRSAIDKAGLAFDVETPPLSQPAYVDRDMWETVVLNLVSNAFKFTHEGSIAVRLHEADGRAVLRVQDTGTGIPAAELPKLFDRFYSVAGAKGRSFEGSGIGLALVQEIVKLHGGDIAVASAEATGTTFTITLPLGTAHLPAERVMSSSLEASGSPRARAFVEEALRWLPEDGLSEVLNDLGGSQKPTGAAPGGAGTQRDRVLLADDNADLRDYIGRLLVDAGYDVTIAADGEAALAKLAASRPDLIITDVMMPRLDDFGLLARVRRQDDLLDVPVIMLSARAGEEAKVEGLERGADDYLTKPFSARELLARVSANIKLARIRREAADTIRASEQRLRELNATLEQRVAEALVEKRLFARIVEETDTSVQVVAPDFRFLAINTTAQRDFERVFGARAEVGDSILEVLAHLPVQAKAAERVWTRALAGERFTETAWWGGDAHERRAYETRFSPLFDANGRRIGAYVLGQDVTDRLRQVERLAEAEEQLRQAQKMEAMGQLTGGVAHDFNNLLTPIVGALDLLQRRSLGGEREQRLIAGAAQSAERAKMLVQRLLAFARRQPLRPTAVNIAALVNGMADLIASTTGPQIQVSVDVPDSLPPATADPNQLELALLNLAVNARDAMPEGGTLRIGAEEEAVGPRHRAKLVPGRYLRLWVADVGVGMDEATLARAVEPFFSTKGVGKGTGLGLSMVHGLASQLGGAMAIQSRRGVGTTIDLWLPVSDGHAAEDAAPSVSEKASRAAGTALLVDDEDLVRTSTADMLAELGYSVVEARSADEALRFIRDGGELDFLLTDHLMPGMNGTDLARVVRSERPRVKVLLVSGFADVEGVAPDLPRLVKPFRKDELAASLSALTSRALPDE